MKTSDLLIGLGLLALVLSAGGAELALDTAARKRASKEGRKAVLDVFTKAGYPRHEAYAAIMIESGWKPGAVYRNKQGVAKAAGLNQMTENTLRALHFSGGVEAFAQLSAEEQAPWIAKLIRSWGPWQVPGDTYLFNFWGSAMGGSPDSLVLARVGTDVWKANPGIREGSYFERLGARGGRIVPGEGPITAGSVRQTLVSAMRAYPLPEE